MYKAVNDYELLYLVSENNEDAYNEIYKKYEKFVKALALKYFKNCKYSGISFEDVYQAGMCGLFSAVNHYDDKNNALFYTYVTAFVSNEIITFLKKNTRNKHNILSDSISFEQKIDEDGNTLECFLASDETAASTYYDYENKLELFLFRHDLPFLHSQIYELKMNNFSNKEISILLDIKYKTVDNAITTIKNKLRKLKYN